MLKKSASGVLASFSPSTYPSGYASVLHSLRPCWTAFLSILRERSLVAPYVPTIKFSRSNMLFQLSRSARLATWTWNVPRVTSST